MRRLRSLGRKRPSSEFESWPDWVVIGGTTGERTASWAVGLRRMSSDRKPWLAVRLAKTWRGFVIGLGVAASIAWVAAVGWLLLKAVRLILRAGLARQHPCQQNQ